LGLAVNPNNQDLFIGDDPTFAILVNPPLNKGHIFTIPGNNAPVLADCAGTAAAPTCALPQPPSTAVPSLYAYGMTAPKGGILYVPSADGGHMWAADHSQGLCRMDVVKARAMADGSFQADPLTGTAIGVNGYNSAACDDGTLLGSGGQVAYDDTPLPTTVGTVANPGTDANGKPFALHYLYVAQNDHLSPGGLRFTYDPTADPDPTLPAGSPGRGMLVAGSGVVMAPNAGLDGDKANGLALGPCKVGAPASCTHALYMGGLLDGFIRRINNPLDDPRLQTVDVVAETTEQKAGVGGKGINGSMGMIGDDLYLPENQGFTVVRGISKCPVNGAVCFTNPLPIGQFGFIFGSAVGTDQDLTHSAAGLVYTAISPGIANATVYQYDVATNTARIYATQGRMPAAGTADATVFCTTTCTRPVDPANPPGGLANFHFAQGIFITPDQGLGSNVFITEDAFAGARAAAATPGSHPRFHSRHPRLQPRQSSRSRLQPRLQAAW